MSGGGIIGPIWPIGGTGPTGPGTGGWALAIAMKEGAAAKANMQNVFFEIMLVFFLYLQRDLERYP
ncbi:hypothetical protein AA102526_1719 [Asaia lannensis NBRC 102526]|nr:hypothetical protein AA102526_1719 [Asaia lannensis NBRC 102526]